MGGMGARGRLYLECAGFALAYVAVAKLGLMMDAVAGFATLVWPASGLSLALLFLRGTRVWPAVTLGAFVTNLWIGAPPAVALGIAVGNTLEAVAGAAALRFAKNIGASFERVRGALALIFASLMSTWISATIGVLSLRAGGLLVRTTFFETWRAWWVGDALGDLVVAPLVLAWTSKEVRDVRVAGRLESAALASVLVAMGVLVFGRHAPTQVIGQAYFVYPVLMWAALRFGQRGATSATFLCGVLAIIGTAVESGPFVRASLHESLLVLQLFMAITAATFLIVGASIYEKRTAVRDLRVSQMGLETRVEEGAAALSRANERLLLLKQLEEAVGARDALISIASHELRTPLAALQLHLDLMTRSLRKQPEKESVPDRMMSKLGTLDRQVERLAKLIDHLLDVSRLTAGRLDLALEEVDLAAVAREVASRFEEVLHRAECQVTVRAPVPIVGSWDRLRLEQIVTNLLSNAGKYGSGKPIEIEVAGNDQKGLLSVRDHGIGIPFADQARIFERFERLLAGREAPGFGLGLWIVRQVVEGMRGEIRVTSEVGHGATFFVELPRRAVADRPLARSDVTPSSKRAAALRSFENARKN